MPSLEVCLLSWDLGARPMFLHTFITLFRCLRAYKGGTCGHQWVERVDGISKYPLSPNRPGTSVE